MTIAARSGALRYFRWPYQANVIKMFEQIRSRTVFMALESYHGRSWFSRILPSLRDRPGWASEDQLWTVVRRNPLECLTLLDPSGRRNEATKHVREKEGKAAAF